jgi:hypothetical protein
LRAAGHEVETAPRFALDPAFDPPTETELQHLDVADAISRCIDQVGWAQFRKLVWLVASARGER